MSIPVEVADIPERLAEFEAAAGSALDAGDEAQAGQLARRIAAIMDERAAHLGAAAECGGVAERLRANLERNVRLLAELKRGLATARAAAAMRRVNDHARRGAGLSDSAIQEARRTLERIRNRQAEQRDFDEAMDRVASDPDLAAPGSGWSRPPRETNPDDVLARLKRQRGQRTT